MSPFNIYIYIYNNIDKITRWTHHLREGNMKINQAVVTSYRLKRSHNNKALVARIKLSRELHIKIKKDKMKSMTILEGNKRQN